MDTLSVHQQLDLLRLHILREFLRLHGIDVEDKGFEIGSLLDRIMDRDVDIVAKVRAVRNFGRVNHNIKVDEYLPPLVMEAVAKGLDAFGVSWTKDGPMFTLNLNGATQAVGLLDAKKLVGLLQSL